MAKRNSADTGGFISCKCKTPYSKSSISRVGVGSDKKLKKLTKRHSLHYNHAYGVEKGTQLSIGTLLDTCKCTLFSGKERSNVARRNRKNKSYVRTRQLKGVDHVRVTYT